MNSSAVRLAIPGLIAILAAAPCTANPAERPPVTDLRPIDEEPPDPGDDACALTGIACIAGVTATIAACELCVTVVGCIACGGAASATIAACVNYADRCIGSHAREGDLCIRSSRCETGNLHCVNNLCTSSLGPESARCSTTRDCQAGLTCLPDGEEPDRTAGKCWRMRNAGELCASSAECQAPLVCDPTSHSCRTPGCSETIGGPAFGCACTVDSAHPAPRGDCPSGYTCESGRCAQVTVTVCNCDGTDPPGTCLSCQEPPVGGGPFLPIINYFPTCYYFYDARTYYTCASYGSYSDCSDPVTEYILTDSFCI